MRSKEILASIVVVGAVATIAFLNTQSAQNGVNFLGENEHSQAFSHFVNKYRRSYGTKEEYAHRQGVFMQNYHRIMNHNMMNSEEEGYFMVVNEFADLSAQEFKMKMGFKKIDKSATQVFSESLEELRADAPKSLDWRDLGAVTPVKNQGSCGSCWAFSTTGAIEGLNKISSGTLVSLSEQQLVDCDTKHGNMGCNGGDMALAMKYVSYNGLESETDYPYTGRDGNCKYDATKAKTKCKGPKNITPKDPNALMNAIIENPVSIAIEADTMVFQFYGGGVLKSTSCGTDLDHGVLLIGYGTENMVDYWLLKNSWGSGWGEKGYFKLLRDMTKKGPGICGVQLEPVQPL